MVKKKQKKKIAAVIIGIVGAIGGYFAYKKLKPSFGRIQEQWRSERLDPSKLRIPHTSNPLMDSNM